MIFLMDLPKPIHGMSNINKKMKERFDKFEEFKVINTVPSYLSFLFGTKAWFSIKIFHSMWCFLRLLFCIRSCERIYRPINGGSGQVFDIIYALLMKLFKCKVIIHHHSFAYINEKSHLFLILLKLIGKDALHLTLGESMSEKLANLYAIDKKQIKVLSNIAFFDEPEKDNEIINKLEDEITIGYLSNISINKGIDVFINVVEELISRGVNVKAIIAGPFSDSHSSSIVNKACKKNISFEYIGPLYGDDKTKFFRSLDIFLFPSQYVNEAEPLVLYEAAVHGVFLLGSQQGCMKDVIENLKGQSFPIHKNFVSLTVDSVIEAINKHKFNDTERAERESLFKSQKVRYDQILLDLSQIFFGSKDSSDITCNVQRTDKFEIPEGFRGKSSWYVQLWWLVQSTLFGMSPQFMYSWRVFLLRTFGAKVGESVIIRPSVRITYPWKVELGNHSWIGDNVEIYSLGQIKIGDYSVVSQRSYLCGGGHDYQETSFPIYSKDIEIGSEAWLASGVFVAPGVKIGKGAVVGAGSYVFKNMPDNMVCIGNPAKPIKPRNPNSKLSGYEKPA